MPNRSEVGEVKLEEDSLLSGLLLQLGDGLLWSEHLSRQPHASTHLLSLGLATSREIDFGILLQQRLNAPVNGDSTNTRFATCLDSLFADASVSTFKHEHKTR